MKYHAFSFFPSFVRYNIFYIEIYGGNSFFLGTQEEMLFGIGCANVAQFPSVN